MSKFIPSYVKAIFPLSYILIDPVLPEYVVPNETMTERIARSKQVDEVAALRLGEIMEMEDAGKAFQALEDLKDWLRDESSRFNEISEEWARERGLPVTGH